MSIRWTLALAAMLILAMAGAEAEERRMTVAASPELIESGLLKHMLPRFSLKTSIRTTPVPLEPGVEADVLVGPAVDGGRPVFRGGETVYLAGPGGGAQQAQAARFLDWLASDIGQRTVASFAPDGKPLYEPAADAKVEAKGPAVTGDAVAGERLALVHCGRCHVVGPKNRMGGIGSTPSFAMLRTLGDWERRFRAFFTLNPHPAFTQVSGVTPPFDEARPPPIAPLEVTLADIDAILAYVAALAPADLAEPLKYQ